MSNLAELPEYHDVVSLVPGSCVQFLDFGLSLERVGHVRRTFWDKPPSIPGSRSGLGIVIEDADGALRDADGRVVPDERVYTVDAKRVLEGFARQWLPLPFLRVIEYRDGEPSRFAKGPLNWVRVHVAPLDEPDRHQNTHRLTVAFDTELLPFRPDRAYLAPAVGDVQAGRDFALASALEHFAWFLDEAWVADWLDRVFQDGRVLAHRRRSRSNVPLPAAEHPSEAQARYVVLLDILRDLAVLPRVKFYDTETDPAAVNPIDVDLLVDVGNSRTCGVLVEFHRDKALELTDSHPLRIRDLSRPELVHGEPFDTRLEFALPRFGHEIHSRRSGRANAFTWPHIVRIGNEAVRLSHASRGSAGSTGMSSPKRYLWDTRKRVQPWRFNAISGDDGQTEPTISEGVYVGLVRETGEPLGEDDLPMLHARFSRSSLMSFVLSEIVFQALVQMNAPGQQRIHTSVPRRLRRIILTQPTAMPLEERLIYKRRAKDAVQLAWRALGWDRDDGGYRRRPDVRMDWDEATCTQLVFLYSEIAEKLRSKGQTLMDVLGRVRPDRGTHASLRVASIDIGGGTTDLIITTYVDDAEGTAQTALRPTQEFREGFNVAGDDIVKQVIEDHVLPAMRRHMESIGVRDARSLLTELLGSELGGQKESLRVMRRHFANQIAAPIGLALLGWYEESQLKIEDRELTRSFGDFFSRDLGPNRRVLDFFEGEISNRAQRPFRFEDVLLTVTDTDVDTSVRAAIGQILGCLCEIVHAYDCDTLLLSGRPSRLPAVLGCVHAKLPVSPDRIHCMHRYRVGKWYPFRDASDRIRDPKTTAVLGAVVGTLAERALPGFRLATEQLNVRSTARFIGEMEGAGVIRRAHVLFERVDLDDPEAELPERWHEMHAPFHIGFRQLDVERWPPTPLYYVEFASPEAAERLKDSKPLRLLLGQREGIRHWRDDESLELEAVKESFEIREIEDRDGQIVNRSAIVLRLQTLPAADGYWTETGLFDVH